MAPYFWASSISGDVTTKGIPAHMAIPFSDLFRNLDFAGQIHAEAWRNRWGLFVDTTYIDLSASGQGFVPQKGPAIGTIGQQEWMVEFGGFYRLAKWPLGKDEKTALAL